MKIFSQLKKALLEKFASDPVTELEEGRVVYNTTEKAAKIFNGTSWTELGSGGSGGSSGINFIDNGDFENTTITGWSTYDDGASAVPIDGAGGTSLNLTLSSEGTVELNGSYCMKIAKGAANAQGEGAVKSFTIPKAYRNINNAISLVYSTDGAYAAGDMAVFLYDVDAGKLITPRISQITGYDKDNPGSVNYRTDFDVADTTSVNYRFLFHCTSTNASAYDLYVDDIEVGPGDVASGDAVSNDTAFVPILGGITTTDSVNWRQVGEYMEIFGSVNPATLPGGPLILTVPNGKTIDTSKFGDTTSDKTVLGVARLFDSGAAVYFGHARYISATTVGFDSLSTGASWSTTSPVAVLSVADTLSFQIRIPIAEWAGKTASNLGANDVEYYSYYDETAVTAATTFSDQSKVLRGANGSLFADISAAATGETIYQIALDNPQETDVYDLQVKVLDGAWVSFSSLVSINSHSKQNGYSYGLTYRTTATHLEVRFGNGGRVASGATFASAGSTWSGLGTEFRWRVVKHRSGIPVGFGQATSEHSGLVKSDVDYITSADATTKGLVTTEAQTFAGQKIFNDNVLLNGSELIGNSQNDLQISTRPNASNGFIRIEDSSNIDGTTGSIVISASNDSAGGDIDFNTFTNSNRMKIKRDGEINFTSFLSSGRIVANGTGIATVEANSSFLVMVSASVGPKSALFHVVIDNAGTSIADQSVIFNYGAMAATFSVATGQLVISGLSTGTRKVTVIRN